MMMNLLRIFIVLIMFCVTAKADKIPATQLFLDVIKPLETPVFELTPLSGWGDISFPASEQEEDLDNIFLQGAFSQGMILVKYSKKTLLKTYATFKYAKDSEKFDWNNRAELGVGIKINHAVNNKFAIATGVEYKWSYRPETERTLKDLTAYIDWFAWWSFDSSSYTYPGNTWGGVSYSLSYHEDFELSGAIEQGVDWYSFGKVTVNSFVRFAYTLEPEDHWENSNVTYGIGSKLKTSVTDDAAIHVGFLFNQNKDFESGQTENRISSFLSWYF